MENERTQKRELREYETSNDVALPKVVWATCGKAYPGAEIGQALAAGFDVVEVVEADNSQAVAGAVIHHLAMAVLGAPSPRALHEMHANAKRAVSRGRWMTQNMEKAVVCADIPWYCPEWRQNPVRCEFLLVGRLRVTKILDSIR